MTSPVRPLNRLRIAAVALACLASACGRPAALGEADSLIVVADPALWAELEEETYEAIETTLFTIRDEKQFYITYVAPDSDELDQLLLWKQVVVFGVPGDPLLEQVSEAAGRELSPPEIFQVPNVWAGGQAVTAVVLRPGAEADSWREALPELHELLDRQFRLWALSRMWVSGEDSVLADSLDRRLGFRMRVPAVYGHQFREDDLVVIRNDNPDPSDLIRSILVQRRPRLENPTAESIFEWRAGIDSLQYSVPQSFEPASGPGRQIEVDGARGLEVRGAWRDESDYPAGGPFFARALTGPDATYFSAAWRYSPNPRRSKWQYIMQMEEILGSFSCSSN